MSEEKISIKRKKENLSWQLENIIYNILCCDDSEN